MDDDLILMFIGKHEEDLNYLSTVWQQRNNTFLASAIPNLTSNKTLQFALEICTTPALRDAPHKPVDTVRIHQDVIELQSMLGMTFSSTGTVSIAHNFLELILPRNQPGIQQLALYFERVTGCKLDEKIRKSSLDDMTTKIAVHAIRSAQDPTYRDVMSLKDVLYKSDRQEDLAIRICRAHWYGIHWNQIQAGWMGIAHGDFQEKVMKMPRGVFRDLIMAMIETAS